METKVVFKISDEGLLSVMDEDGKKIVEDGRIEDMSDDMKKLLRLIFRRHAERLIP